MLNRYDEVKKLNLEGHNCAQSIVCAYKDVVKLPHEELYRMTEALGGGFGLLQQTCGALTGAFLVASALKSTGLPTDPEARRQNYAEIRKLHAGFVEKMGSDNCKVLRKGEKPKAFVCQAELKAACDILEDYFKAQGIEI